jgi:hypothetical protein
MANNIPEERPQFPHPVFNEDNAYSLAKMLGAWAVGLGPQYMAYQKGKGLLDAVGTASDAYGVMTGEPYASAKAFYGEVPVINYTHMMQTALDQADPTGAAPIVSYEGTGLQGDPKNNWKIIYDDEPEYESPFSKLGKNPPAGGLLKMVDK